MDNRKLHYVTIKKKEVRNKVGLCSFPNCNEKTSANHVYPKILLKNICNENNEVIAKLEDNEFKLNRKKKEKFYFEHIGIQKIRKNIQGIQCLCNVHDSSIFSSIDSNNFSDKLSYHDCMLYSYKALIYEIMKQKTAVNLYDELQQSAIGKEICFEQCLNKSRDIFKHYESPFWKRQKFYFDNYIKHINSGVSKKFKFMVFDLNEKIGFFMISAMSAAFNARDYFSIKTNDIESLFIHVLPFRDKTVVVVGGTWLMMMRFLPQYAFDLKENDYKLFIEPDFVKHDILSFVSDKAITVAENWIVSPDFYNVHIKNRENYLIEVSKYKYPRSDQKFFRKKNPFINLFEDEDKSAIVIDRY